MTLDPMRMIHITSSTIQQMISCMGGGCLWQVLKGAQEHHAKKNVNIIYVLKYNGPIFLHNLTFPQA